MSENNVPTEVDKSVIDTSEVGYRLEAIQKLRFKAIEEIANIPKWVGDEGLSITMTSLLRDAEKQELIKAKMKQDDENAKTDQDIARQAIEIVGTIRNQHRDIVHGIENADVPVNIPMAIDKHLPEQGDEIALSAKDFVEENWESFERRMIQEGLDPTRRIDDTTGEIVSTSR